MTYNELINWMSYFDEYPIGYREDYRAYFIGSASGNLPKGTKPGDCFPSLKSKATLEESAFDLVEDITKSQAIENRLKEGDDG